MLEIIFVDIPLLLVSYAGLVFLILKFLGPREHDDCAKEFQENAPPFNSSKDRVGKLEAVDASSLGYEEHRKSAEACEVRESSQITGVNLPTDSCLKRHYVSNLLTLATSIHPRPQEATLKRHQRQLVLSLVEEMLEDSAKIEVVENMVREIRRLDLQPSLIVNGAVCLAEPIHCPAAVSSDIPPTSNFVDIPQEVTLRRHFIQNFIAKLEEKFPRPTDSTLVRHYNQWLDSEVEDLLCQSG